MVLKYLSKIISAIRSSSMHRSFCFLLLLLAASSAQQGQQSDATSTIVVTIIDSSRIGIVGASVRLNSVSSQQDHEYKTDTQGKVTIVTTPGGYILQITHKGFLPQTKTINIKPGERQEIEAQLPVAVKSIADCFASECGDDPSTKVGTIIVTVLDPSRAVVAGAHIQLESKSGVIERVTNDEGVARIDATPRHYQLIVFGNGFRRVTQGVDVKFGGLRELSVTLPPVGDAVAPCDLAMATPLETTHVIEIGQTVLVKSIDGTVAGIVLDNLAKPVQNAKVEDKSNDGMKVLESTFTHNDGFFSLQGSGLKSHYLQVSAPGYLLRIRVVVDKRRGKPLKIVLPGNQDPCG